MIDFKNINFNKDLVAEHWKDKSFVAESVRRNSDFLLYADEILKNDYDFILFLLEQNKYWTGGSIKKEHVWDDLRDNEYFILDVINLIWTYWLIYASDKLKKDEIFIRKLIKQDIKFFEYIDESLKCDISILIDIGWKKTTKSMINFINSEVVSEKYDMSEWNVLMFVFCDLYWSEYIFRLTSWWKYAYSELLKDGIVLNNKKYYHNWEDSDIPNIHSSFIYTYEDGEISLCIADFKNELEEDEELIFMHLSHTEEYRNPYIQYYIDL